MSEQADKQGLQNKAATAEVAAKRSDSESAIKVKEIGGPKGPEPTRFGDWERKGRCVDF